MALHCCTCSSIPPPCPPLPPTTPQHERLQLPPANRPSFVTSSRASGLCLHGDYAQHGWYQPNPSAAPSNRIGCCCPTTTYLDEPLLRAPTSPSPGPLSFHAHSVHQPGDLSLPLLHQPATCPPSQQQLQLNRKPEPMQPPPVFSEELTFFWSLVFMSTAYSSLVTSHSSTMVCMCSTDLQQQDNTTHAQSCVTTDQHTPSTTWGLMKVSSRNRPRTKKYRPHTHWV